MKVKIKKEIKDAVKKTSQYKNDEWFVIKDMSYNKTFIDTEYIEVKECTDTNKWYTVLWPNEIRMCLINKDIVELYYSTIDIDWSIFD